MTRKPVAIPGNYPVGKWLILTRGLLHPSKDGTTTGAIRWSGQNFKAQYRCRQLAD
jgi:hypothetical protein